MALRVIRRIAATTVAIGLTTDSALSLIDLCDATQQLHLGLQSWRSDWDHEFNKQLAKKGKPTGSVQTA